MPYDKSLGKFLMHHHSVDDITGLTDYLSGKLSWTMIRALVRRGVAQNYFKVGDLLSTEHTLGTGGVLWWRVAGFNHYREQAVPYQAANGTRIYLNATAMTTGSTAYWNQGLTSSAGTVSAVAGSFVVAPGTTLALTMPGTITVGGVVYSCVCYSMALESRRSIGDSLFDEREYAYKLTADATFQAGTTYYTAALTADTTRQTGKTYYEQVTDGSTIGFLAQIEATDWTVGAAITGSVYELTAATVTTGAAVTANTYYVRNGLFAISGYRQGRDGLVDYEKSALRQYINSAASANYWSSQWAHDRRPASGLNIYSAAGFVAGFSDQDFLNAIGSPRIQYAKNTVVDSGGSLILTDKFFIPSYTEVYGLINGTVQENGQLPIYQGTTDAGKIKYDLAGTTAKIWRLRSSSVALPTATLVVSTTGSVSSELARSSRGTIVACAIM